MPRMLVPRIMHNVACLLHRSAPHTEYVLDYVVERKRVDDLAGRSAPDACCCSLLSAPAVFVPFPAEGPHEEHDAPGNI